MEYPPAILTPNPALPGHVVKIDPAKCVACNQCADICRCNVIMPNPVPGQPPLLVYPDECWLCSACTENCPTGAIEFDHPIHQKVTWKRKDTGELFRIGMKNPPPPVERRAYGDRNVYLDPAEVITMRAGAAEKLSRYVVRARLDKLEGDIPFYHPGSFCNVKIGEDSYRGYSMGNPHNGEYIELYIDIFPDGPGSKFFAALKPGDSARVTLPLGRFRYVPKQTPALLVGSVTGIAPIKAIIEQELLREKSGRRLHLLFQVWAGEDVFLKDHFDDLAARFPCFTWDLLFASRPRDGIKLDGQIANLDLPFPETDAYICASKPLVKTVEKVLLEKGAFWRNIHYESFMQ